MKRNMNEMMITAGKIALDMRRSGYKITAEDAYETIKYEKQIEKEKAEAK